MQPDVRLTPTSYIVLGLLDAVGEATPYDLKQLLAASVGNFWTVQHSALYAEPERLTEGGYVSERREQGGRRRRRYRVTAKGRRALRQWASEPTAELPELRDPGLLKLFFGADPKRLAAPQLEAHRAKLAEYQDLYAAMKPGDGPAGPRLALEAGIAHEREWVRYWQRLAG
ncbi:MAG TPA: PadR family transcriptional regulator [Solirubrobacteraceae bacterium]|jgi:DNA-binding PadR family transcriptional regulator|nr:PadR family transcriptional regulator [Solirubrobacteraceae bacterium]